MSSQIPLKRIVCLGFEFIFCQKSYDNAKDCNIKKETNLEAYISVNFLQILTKSAPQIM